MRRDVAVPSVHVRVAVAPVALLRVLSMCSLLPLLLVHLMSGQHGLPHLEKVVVHVGWEVDLMAVHKGEPLQDAWP